MSLAMLFVWVSDASDGSDLQSQPPPLSSCDCRSLRLAQPRFMARESGSAPLGFGDLVAGQFRAKQVAVLGRIGVPTGGRQEKPFISFDVILGDALPSNEEKAEVGLSTGHSLLGGLAKPSGG